MSVVTVTWEDLSDPTQEIGEKIREAFGLDGLGVIAISGVPDWEMLLTESLPLAHRLVTLPKESLDKLEHPESLYNAGWSFGKEKLGDKPDTNKGSFYFNPLSDDPRPDIREAYPWALPSNLWPRDDLPVLEEPCKNLGRRMHEVVVALAKHVDKLDYGLKIADELESSMKSKARLLYYFPIPEEQAEAIRDKPDGWIGWHNDSGFLTGLTPDIFLNHETGEIIPNPEPETAGLWVASRSGLPTRVVIPRHCMAIQCGECLQVVSGGKLVATPHCVRPPTHSPGVSRACCPIFVDSTPEFRLTSPNGRDAALQNTVKQWVPPLADRWKDGQTFAEFLGDTFQAYYSWTVREK
eukprot:CAMPEP_0202957962 /NCGR_PEP_ID=MMETSP1396-20130829/2318_1 /ASSEMBLY_ACC=CAM_ASM_000872 /TAXON_ID= /ORGANISM="Pseudokeronopsis sp., Strain Brazil" /LENGTH=351 /DNA_ID=CAMNT_0049675719 /DNA_START=81 /DNA_END=1136 /DNA_ORIENTATION=-